MRQYNDYIAAKGRRPQPLPHWRRMLAIRQHDPVRLDLLAEIWAGWLAAHDDDLHAALGSLVAHLVDEGDLR